MNFSYSMIEQLKAKLDLKSDVQVCDVLPKITSGNLSQVKSGKRHLTEEQALFIADVCALDIALVLVELAAESAKSTKAQSVWHDLAKKLKAASSTLLLAAFLTISGTSGLNQGLRIKSSP
jgi:hypothetical protein